MTFTISQIIILLLLLIIHTITMYYYNKTMYNLTDKPHIGDKIICVIPIINTLWLLIHVFSIFVADEIEKAADDMARPNVKQFNKKFNNLNN